MWLRAAASMHPHTYVNLTPCRSNCGCAVKWRGALAVHPIAPADGLCGREILKQILLCISSVVFCVALVSHRHLALHDFVDPRWRVVCAVIIGILAPQGQCIAIYVAFGLQHDLEVARQGGCNRPKSATKPFHLLRIHELQICAASNSSHWKCRELAQLYEPGE